jgi:hypothetical protein
MNIFPFLLLGLMILPESIIHVPIFPMGKADAHPIASVAADADAGVEHNLTSAERGLECDACMYLTKGINETILHNPKVLAIVTDDLDKVCAVLPESVQALCTSAAEQTAPLLLNHLGDFIATDGCADLGVCHN